MKPVTRPRDTYNAPPQRGAVCALTLCRGTAVMDRWLTVVQSEDMTAEQFKSKSPREGNRT